MPDEASRVWAEDMSAAYDEYLVAAIFRPYADDLASRVAHHRPRVVLELAAGPGVLTRATMASLPGARVTATDLNFAMVDVGSARVPAATWRQADAMQLPFGDASTLPSLEKSTLNGRTRQQPLDRLRGSPAHGTWRPNVAPPASRARKSPSLP